MKSGNAAWAMWQSGNDYMRGGKVAWEPQRAALPKVPCIAMSLLFSFNRQPPSPPRSKTTHGTADMQSLQGSRLYDWLSAWIPQFT